MSPLDRPHPDAFKIENIPSQLRAMRRWVLVRREYYRDPDSSEFILCERRISYHTGQECGPDFDPREWATLEEVHGAWQRWPAAFDGVAIALGGAP
jgi:hypothetical protein